MSMNEVHQGRELSTEVDWLGGKLRPLREGKPVAFALIPAKRESKIKRVVEPKDKIITIMPGTLLNLPRRVVVVSVIDNGSCIVEINCNVILGLVRAGIPAKLARILLNKLRQTMKEEDKHGNDSTAPRSTRKKRTSSSTTRRTRSTARASTAKRKASTPATGSDER